MEAEEDISCAEILDILHDEGVESDEEKSSSDYDINENCFPQPKLTSPKMKEIKNFDNAMIPPSHYAAVMNLPILIRYEIIRLNLCQKISPGMLNQMKNYDLKILQEFLSTMKYSEMIRLPVGKFYLHK